MDYTPSDSIEHRTATRDTGEGELRRRGCTWCLTGRLDESIQSFPIDLFPYRVGRKADCALTISRATVSGNHAELVEEANRLWIVDLGSTNGTFVNGVPVDTRRALSSGDLIQFADTAFRITQEASSANNATLQGPDGSLEQAMSLVRLDQMMNERTMVPFYQPIVTIPGRQNVGYEVLGRSKVPGLSTPRDMFLAASQLNLEEQLSQMLRMAGLKNATGLNTARLYLNTHPMEMVTFGLLESLRDMRRDVPDYPITLEVHEAAVTDVETMVMLSARLRDLDIQLAFDDFGAGQSRLLELAKVNPDVVKVDMKLIRDIDTATIEQQRMVGNLVHMVKELGIISLAEGVETQAEHEVCLQLGFELGQGYFYGEPAAAEAFAESENALLV